MKPKRKPLGSVLRAAAFGFLLHALLLLFCLVGLAALLLCCWRVAPAWVVVASFGAFFYLLLGVLDILLGKAKG